MHRISVAIAGLSLVFLSVGGCARADSAAADSAVAVTRADDTPAGAPVDSGGAFAVHAAGAGPLRVGMTFAEAATALKGAVPDTNGLERACSYVPLDGLPPGLLVMWVEGRIARIDVDSISIATAEGARLGDDEARIRTLYAGRVTEKPHKYDDRGRYLVVPAPATGRDSLALVFETDGAKVTRYRVGRQPQVEWVEGCS